MLYEQIISNKRKTIIFVLTFIIFALIIGGVFGDFFLGDYVSGITFTVVMLMVYLLITINNSQSIVMYLNHARKIEPEDNMELYNILEEICIVARLRKVPDLYIIEEDSPNAFATGISPDKASIAVTTALLKELNREELEGVLAHEVAHIINYDIRLSTITLSLLSVIILICDIGIRSSRNDKDSNVHPLIALFVMILAPLLAQIINFAISRNREYLADATAVELTRNPYGLISALSKLDGNPDIVDNISPNSATMYIVDPLKKRFNSEGKKVKKAGLFSTHPSIEERIDRLNKM